MNYLSGTFWCLLIAALIGSASYAGYQLYNDDETELASSNNYETEKDARNFKQAVDLVIPSEYEELSVQKVSSKSIDLSNSESLIENINTMDKRLLNLGLVDVIKPVNINDILLSQESTSKEVFKIKSRIGDLKELASVN